MTELRMCDCARTREYCVTQGCKRDEFKWRYSTEGRGKDHLRRVIDLRRRQVPASNWLRPDRAIALAWTMNMESRPEAIFVEKLGRVELHMEGVP